MFYEPPTVRSFVEVAWQLIEEDPGEVGARVRRGRECHLRRVAGGHAVKRGPKPKPLVKIPAELLKRYEAGELSIPTLARLLGIPAPTVHNVLRRLGIDTSKRTRCALFRARAKNWSRPQDLYGKTVELHGQGMSLKQIGEQVGYTHEGVRLILKRHGVKSRPKGRRPQSERDGQSGG